MFCRGKDSGEKEGVGEFFFLIIWGIWQVKESVVI